MIVMKKRLFLGIFLSVLMYPSMVLSSNVIPNVTVSATSSATGMSSTNIVNGSGLSSMEITAVHDASGSGSTMWRSNTVFSNVRLTFDLKSIYALEQIYVWNYNQPGEVTCGLKNISIEYSTDNVTWTVLPAPSLGYESNADYPFLLQQAVGKSGLKATNLADGNGTPIEMGGVHARYVRFTASKTAGVGNYGGKYFGLSEVMFTTNDVIDNVAYTITVKSETKEKQFGNLIFGGCHVPSLAHFNTIVPQMVECGFNFIRSDMWLETVLPQNITYEGYLNNVDDAQNPDTWDFYNLEQVARAKKAGMKVMLIISYCPAWLAYNGKTSGIPKDMKVYADIVRKVYERYYRYVDFVEIYNEPGYFVSIENSPYSSVGAALAEIYVTCAEVVRSITPDMPIGGTSVVTHSDGGVGGSTNRDFFADKRINKNNFNFYSHHVYGDYGIETENETVTRVKNELAKFGYGDLPIYFTEWSTSINNAADSVTYIGSKSHLFVGSCLVNWMRDGLTGAHHWNYLQAVSTTGAYESGISRDAHGMYSWNPRTKEGELLPKAYVFKLLSKTLGFGKGENRVVKTEENTNGMLNILSAVNADGELATMIVNNTPSAITIKVDMAGAATLMQYTVTYSQRGEEGVSVLRHTDGLYRVTIQPLSVTGLKYVN